MTGFLSQLELRRIANENYNATIDAMYRKFGEQHACILNGVSTRECDSNLLKREARRHWDENVQLQNYSERERHLVEGLTAAFESGSIIYNA